LHCALLLSVLTIQLDFLYLSISFSRFSSFVVCGNANFSFCLPLLFALAPFRYQDERLSEGRKHFFSLEYDMNVSLFVFSSFSE
jgi:hypothetical protein